MVIKIQFFRLSIIIGTLFLCAGLSVYADETHTIKKGETMYQLAQKYGVPVDMLLEANNISNPNFLSTGQTLHIPSARSNDADTISGSVATINTTSYKVQKGDTLYSIAHDHKMTLYALRRYNKNVSDDIRIGQIITIPLQQTILAKNKTNDTKTNNTLSTKTASSELNSFGALNESDLLNNAKAIGRISGGWPLAGNGYILRGKLPGMLIEGKEGAAVAASHAGVVVYASLHTSFSNVLVIQGDDGLVYVYAGQKDIVVKQGERVNKGMILGHLGIMPTLQRPVLYFSLWDKEKSIDPRNFIKG